MRTSIGTAAVGLCRKLLACVERIRSAISIESERVLGLFDPKLLRERKRLIVRERKREGGRKTER